MTVPATPLETIPSLVEAAHDASLIWAATSAADRSKALIAIADALDANADTLIPIAQRETNLATVRLTGELKRTTFQLRLFGEIIQEGSYLDARIDPENADWPMGARPDIRRVLVPLGPVLVFSASNFPFAFSVAGGDTASALAAGNAVIVKAHSGHPELSKATGDIIGATIAELGLPAGLFAVIFGTEAGSDTLKHPLIKAGAFTGSIPGGRALFDIAQSRPEPIPFYGELGSTNPVFVTPAAVATRCEQIVAEYIASFTMGAGQFCTKPGLLLVPAESDFVAQLQAASLPGAAKLLNERIQSGYVETLDELSKHPAIQVLNQADDSYTNPPTPTLLLTSIESLITDPDQLITEVFGPTSLVVTYQDIAQLAEVAELLHGQLTATLVAEESEAAKISPLLAILRRKVGRILWNQWPTGVTVSYAQQHGGPYPATTAGGTTSVGTAAIGRFVRPVAYQNFPQTLLPGELQDANPLSIPRLFDGKVQLP